MDIAGHSSDFLYSADGLLWLDRPAICRRHPIHSCIRRSNWADDSSICFNSVSPVGTPAAATASTPKSFFTASRTIGRLNVKGKSNVFVLRYSFLKTVPNMMAGLDLGGLEIAMVGPFSVGSARDSIGKTTDGFGKATETVRRATRIASTRIVDQAGNAKRKVEELTVKTADPYDGAVAEYNGVFTAMSDKGVSLLRQRERSTDLIELIAMLVNSIANTPKTFEADFEEIVLNKKEFLQSEEFAQRDLEAARQSAAGVGAGFTAGAAVASMAPTAAMWVATTFGTASTGTAISTLSGAAATNATLAWLGGGALVAGGGGTAAGGALLALAGPIGWTIAGATLLTSIALFTKKKFENREAKDEALTAVKQNTALVRSMDAQIEALLKETTSLREALMNLYGGCVALHNANFPALADVDQSRLAILVNNTKSCAALLSKHVKENPGDE